jgi:4a-hydroxytetrahydrobiopterin dehydratase
MMIEKNGQVGTLVCMDAWIEQNNALVKTFQCSDFEEALMFVNTVGDIAQRLEHHPDIAITDYNKVTISSSTHNAGNTVTQKDRALAEAIEAARV